jgi:putative RNA 2'-phosphotransferase
MDKRLVKTRKFLSLVLRHRPETIGLSLDQHGWVSVDHLLAQAHQHGVSLTIELLQQVVALNDKRRFAFSEDGRYIRASQGYSIKVNLGLHPVMPPEILYHGTASQFVESIRQRGIVSGRRTHERQGT